MYPFIEKIRDKLFIRLHKELYGKDLIKKIKKEEPDCIISVRPQKNYYLLELNVDDFGEYFDFLNYLIYLGR